MDQTHTSRQDAIPPWVTAEIRAEIDLSELSNVDPEALYERDSLSAELEANVAAYPAEAKGRPHGLCAVFRSAELSEAQVERLRAAEQKCANVVFVAYCKPLQRHHSGNDL